MTVSMLNKAYNMLLKSRGYLLFWILIWSQSHLVTYFHVNPLIPIGVIKTLSCFQGISGHPRTLRSSVNDSVHAQGRFEKKWLAFGVPTPQNCVVGQKIATNATFLGRVLA